MDHPLRGFGLKMNRAEQHLEAVRRTVERFIQLDFYETVPDLDYKGRLVARLKNVQQPPAELSALIGDCAHNLRSALDHLAFALAAAHSNPLPDEFANTSAFPIFQTGPRFHGKKGRRGAAMKMRGMSRGTRAAIERSQPYHRRKNPALQQLWMLEELSNVDKHRLLHLTGATPAGASFHLEGPGLLRLERIEVVPGVIKEEAVVARFYGEFLPPPAVEVKANVVPNVIFDKSGAARSVRGLPVLDTLYGIRDTIVFAVLRELDAESARLFRSHGGTLFIQIKEETPAHPLHDLRDFA